MHPQTANLTHILKVIFSHSIHPSGPRKHIPQKKMSPRTTSKGICLGRHKHNIYPRPENMVDSFLSQRIHWSPKRVTLWWQKEFQNSVPCLQTEPSYPEQKVLLLTIIIDILILAGTMFWWCPGHGKKTSGASGCNLPVFKPLLPMCTFQKACLTPQGLTAFHQLTNRFPLTQVDNPSTRWGSVEYMFMIELFPSNTFSDTETKTNAKWKHRSRKMADEGPTTLTYGTYTD